MPARSTANVTIRYMAPVSRYRAPSARANPLETEDFPVPAGPSTATTSPLCARSFASLPLLTGARSFVSFPSLTTFVPLSTHGFVPLVPLTGPPLCTVARLRCGPMAGCSPAAGCQAIPGRYRFAPAPGRGNPPPPATGAQCAFGLRAASPAPASCLKRRPPPRNRRPRQVHRRVRCRRAASCPVRAGPSRPLLPDTSWAPHTTDASTDVLAHRRWSTRGGLRCRRPDVRRGRGSCCPAPDVRPGHRYTVGRDRRTWSNACRAAYLTPGTPASRRELSAPRRHGSLRHPCLPCCPARSPAARRPRRGPRRSFARLPAATQFRPVTTVFAAGPPQPSLLVHVERRRLLRRFSATEFGETRLGVEGFADVVDGVDIGKQRRDVGKVGQRRQSQPLQKQLGRGEGRRAGIGIRARLSDQAARQ